MSLKLIILAGLGILVLYYFFSKFLTLFSMNGGKNEDQIITANQDNSRKRFLVKYPEADINTGKNLLMALGFIFAFGTSVFAFSYANKKTETKTLTSMTVDEDFEVEAPQTEQVKPPPPPPPPPPEIEVVKDDKILKNEPDIKSTEIEKNEKVVVPDVIKKEEEVEEQQIFLVVEDMPKFKGCENLKGDAATQCTQGKLQEYLAKVDYPSIAVDNDIEGKVFVSFVVNKDGEIEEVTLLRGADKLLDNAAMKHIKNMPKFASPGKQRGKAVKVKYSVPIVFKLG